jgi:hypothetical protein
MSEPCDFHTRLSGTFYGILQWQQLDALWAQVSQGSWYFYQVGEALPQTPLSGEALATRVAALNTLLRQDHDYHVCGIVYVDDLATPALIKVYDPNNIGSSCSSSDAPSPARWILSIMPPSLIEDQTPVPHSRRRWWQLFHKG